MARFSAACVAAAVFALEADTVMLKLNPSFGAGALGLASPELYDPSIFEVDVEVELTVVNWIIPVDVTCPITTMLTAPLAQPWTTRSQRQITLPRIERKPLTFLDKILAQVEEQGRRVVRN